MSLLQVIFIALLLLITGLIGLLARSVWRWALVRDGGTSPKVLRLFQGRGVSDIDSASWAFYLHRLSGMGIALFLPLHILDIAVFAFLPKDFDELHSIYGSTLMRIFECGLLFALSFHALNGLRIIAADFFNWNTRTSLRVLHLLFVLVLISTFLGSIVIMKPVFV